MRRVQRAMLATGLVASLVPAAYGVEHVFSCREAVRSVELDTTTDHAAVGGLARIIERCYDRAPKNTRLSHARTIMVEVPLKDDGKARFFAGFSQTPTQEREDYPEATFVSTRVSPSREARGSASFNTFFFKTADGNWAAHWAREGEDGELTFVEAGPEQDEIFGDIVEQTRDVLWHASAKHLAPQLPDPREG